MFDSDLNSPLLFHKVSLHKKWNFPLRISSVNMTKFAENYRKFANFFTMFPNTFLSIFPKKNFCRSFKFFWSTMSSENRIIKKFLCSEKQLSWTSSYSFQEMRKWGRSFYGKAGVLKREIVIKMFLLATVFFGSLKVFLE